MINPSPIPGIGPETIDLPNPGPFVPQKDPPGTDLPGAPEAPAGLPPPTIPGVPLPQGL